MNQTTRMHTVFGEKGRWIWELTAVVQEEFGFPEGSVELYAETAAMRGLSAVTQAESLGHQLLGGPAVWRACHGCTASLWRVEPKNCEVIACGTLRGQRAKSMKFGDGLIILREDAVDCYGDTAVCHVLHRQGVLGTGVKLMLPWDPCDETGPEKTVLHHVSGMDPEMRHCAPSESQNGGAGSQSGRPCCNQHPDRRVSLAAGAGI